MNARRRGSSAFIDLSSRWIRSGLLLLVLLGLGLLGVRLWLGRGPAAGSRSAADALAAAGAVHAIESPATRPVSQEEPRAVLDAGPIRDRARADRVRAALKAGLPLAPRADLAAAGGGGRAAPGAFREMPAAPEEGEDGAKSPLVSYIKNVIREQYIPLARQCYDILVEKAPTAKGRILANLVIVGDVRVGGVVDSVEIDDEGTTIIDLEFRNCVRESMFSVVFDAPPEGRLTVGYPLEFSPDPDPEPGEHGGEEQRK